jgi:hypothetical protein
VPLVKYRHFEGTYRFHHQGKKNKRAADSLVTANAVTSSLILSTQMMELIHSSDMSVLTRVTSQKTAPCRDPFCIHSSDLTPAPIQGHSYRNSPGHCVTYRTVTASILDEVCGFLNSPNPSSRNTNLGPARPLTEMSNWNLPGELGADGS